MKQLQLAGSENEMPKLEFPIIDTLVDSIYEDSRTPKREALILRLPDELLSEVVGLAAIPSQKGCPRKLYTQALSLTKVCKRFHRCALPFLYSSFYNDECHTLVPPCEAITNYHRTIKRNQPLGRFCKTVKLKVGDVTSPKSPADYHIATEILCCLPEVTVFECRGGWNGTLGPYLWAMVANALKHMTNIKEMTLYRHATRGLLMTEIINNVRLPALEKLSLYGISAVRTDECGEKRKGLYLRTPFNGYEGTASFTNLEIHDFMERLPALMRLLAWPKKLEHFRFGIVPSNEAQWRLSKFEMLLAPYKASLKSLSLPFFPGEGPATIDLMDFSELTTLTLSREGWECTPEVASSTVLAPRLQHFIWDFGMYDETSGWLIDFTQRDADWLLQFAKLANKRKSALRCIEVSWNNPSEDKGIEDPWTLLEELEIALEAMGIQLKYSLRSVEHGGWIEDMMKHIYSESPRRARG
ncbi:hypothetical protein EJ08DRAFT_702576 [Tothia fuscella]|uniref:F-box domain-containing protein n=1 Tax=Tothia fuscella TaxID=1048955 RepID=A0A9P4NG69_9PEZI|nr:hypothetical protein EJ08DRAFT_702576 [Tothia fuscella]